MTRLIFLSFILNPKLTLKRTVFYTLDCISAV